MPYKNAAELPAAVKKLPARKQRAFLESFNSALKQYEGDESKAFAVAWSAAKGASAEEPKKDACAGPDEKKKKKQGDKKRKRGASYDPHGRLASTWETEEEDDWGDSFAVIGDASVIMHDGPGHVLSLGKRFHDTLTLDAKQDKIEFTDAGYLKAQPRVARTGIQIYGGDECGRPDLREVRVYRPESEVFKYDSLHSFAGIPLTLDHPNDAVSSDNWKEHSIGDVGDEVLRDGNAIRVPLMMRDAKAIAAYKRGTRQLSVGYDCDLKWESGLTADGQPYDAVQTNIKANHLAVVAAARGGPSLTIGDDKGDHTMNLKDVRVAGITVQMTDTAAQVVEKTLQELRDQVENFKKKAKEAEDEEEKLAEDSVKKDELIKAKDVEITMLKGQIKDASDPAKIAERVRDRSNTFARIRRLMGDSYKIDESKSDTELRREVVIAKQPSIADEAKKWGDSEIAVAFKLLPDSGGNNTMVNGTGGGNTFQDAVGAFAGQHLNINDVRAIKERAYQDAEWADENAWRGEEWLAQQRALRARQHA